MPSMDSAWRAARTTPARLAFRELRLALGNVEAQTGVSFAERLFDGGGCLGASEDESQVLPAFRKGNDLLTRVHRDHDVLDGPDCPGFLDTADGDQTAGARNRDHHDARRAPLALERFERAAERVAEDQVFEAEPRSEGERSRTEPPDGARRD